MSKTFLRYSVLSDERVSTEINKIADYLFKQDGDGGDNGWFGDTATSREVDLRREAFQMLLTRYRSEGILYHSHTEHGYVFEIYSFSGEFDNG